MVSKPPLPHTDHKDTSIQSDKKTHTDYRTPSKPIQSEHKQEHRRNLSASSNASLDDILSSSPTKAGNDFLTPKVLTAQVTLTS